MGDFGLISNVSSKSPRSFPTPFPPLRFLRKSAESHEKKRVEFSLSAKLCKILQKSAQRCEGKGDRRKAPAVFQNEKNTRLQDTELGRTYGKMEGRKIKG